MRHLGKTFVAGLLLATPFITAPSAHAATVIETASVWNGAASVFSWGRPDTQVYGQSVTAPGSVGSLTGFSFSIRDSAVAIPYSAFVYAWNGNSITGNALFSQAGLTFGGNGTGNFLPVSFSTNVSVAPGQQYMMFLSTIGEVGGSNTDWGQVEGNKYAGGEFRYFNTDIFADLSSSPWETWVFNGGDLAFTATFDGTTTVVPVPGALGLMLSGAAALGFLGRRRRKA